MPHDSLLVESIENILQKHSVTWTSKRMFGGTCFLVDDKMCLVTMKDGMMVRVAPEEMATLTEKEGAEQMIHRDRPMTGYLKLTAGGIESDESLEFWIVKCLEFNPRAKSSKRKKK